MTTAASAVHLNRVSMVILYARDTMKSAAFYRDALGMKALEASPHWVELDGGGIHLALHAHDKMPAERDAAAPWVVFEVPDVHGAYEALKAKGVAFLSPPKEVCGDDQRVGLSADLLDPDGNRLSVFGFVPRPK